MPVFFFIDPEFEQDHALKNANSLVLSYTFFKTDEDEDDDATPVKKTNTAIEGESVVDHTVTTSTAVR